MTINFLFKYQQVYVPQRGLKKFYEPSIMESNIAVMRGLTGARQQNESERRLKTPILNFY